MPDSVKQELLDIRQDMLSPDSYPIWHPPSLPDMASMDILVVDASRYGYGFHFRSYSMPNSVTEASRVWGPGGAPKLPTGAHDQFSAEVKGMVLAVREVLRLHPPEGRPKVPLLIVSDCQAIPRCMAKAYTHHPALMDFIMDTSPYKDMLYCTWWLGGDHMPADVCSRAGRVHTRTTTLSQRFASYVEAARQWGHAQGYLCLRWMSIMFGGARLSQCQDS